MRYLFLFLLLPIAQIGHAQCCPYLQPVQILPANPTAADPIRLVFQATTPALGNRVSTNFVRSGTVLTFTGCYYSGFLTALQSYSDTVRVGLLPPGSYTVTFIAQQSGSAQQCVEQQRSTGSSTFRVSGTLGTAAVTENLTLYPVPVVGGQLSLTLPASETVSRWWLLDAAGRQFRGSGHRPSAKGRTAKVGATSIATRPLYPSLAANQRAITDQAHHHSIKRCRTKRPAHLREPAVLFCKSQKSEPPSSGTSPI